MSDLISKKDVFDIFKKTCMDVMSLYNFEKIWHEIEILPSAEPEQKTGKWILEDDSVYVHCSECNFYAIALSADTLYNYCPNCGAYMRGD